MAVGRVFLLESPNALDHLDGTGEIDSLASVCALFGHRISTFLIRDKRELVQTLTFVSSIGWQEERGDLPIFIHLSAHGNDEELMIGQDSVSWSYLAAIVVKTFEGIYGRRKPYPGPIVLVVSACGTDGEQLTKHLRTANRRKLLKWPPEYVFVFEDDEIDWRDAVVTWTMFYREAPSIDFIAASEKGGVQRLLDRVNRAGFGSLRYFRWDRRNRRYTTYLGKVRAN